MIRAYDVLNPKQEPQKKETSLFDTLGDFFTEVKEGASSTSKADEMFDIAQKLYDPRGNGIQTEEEYENLKNQYNTLRNEREQSQKLNQEARQRLEANGHDWVAAAGSLGSSLPDMARTMPVAIAAGIPTGGVGTAATIGAGLYGMYRGGRSASIEAFEKVLEDGGTVEQAMNAYNDSLLANSIAEAPGEALNLVGAGRLAKMLKGTNVAQKALGTGVGRIGADLIKDPAKAVGTAVADRFGRMAGRVAGVGTQTVLGAASEVPTEHIQNYVSDITAQRAMGKDVDYLDMNNISKYINSDEFNQTTKDTFLSSLALGGVPAVISSNQMLGNGYNDSKATEIGKVIGNAFGDNGKYKIDSEKLDTFKKIYEGYTGEDASQMPLEELARKFIAFENEERGTTGDINASLVSANDFITAITEDTNRKDYSNSISREILGGAGYNLDYALDKNRESIAKQQSAVNDVLENSKKQQEAEQTNTEGVTLETPNKELGEQVANSNGKSYLDNRRETGEAEVQQQTQPSLFNRLNQKYSRVQEEFEGDDNNLYRVKDRNIRVTKNSEKSYSVTDADNEQGVSKVFEGDTAENDVINFMNDIENGTATVGGQRFMASDKQKLNDGDGVISEKDNPEKQGKTQKDNTRVVRSPSVMIDDFLDYAKSLRGTEYQLDRQMVYEIARAMMRFNTQLAGVTFDFRFEEKNPNNAYGLNTLGFENGRVDIDQLAREGVKNAVIKLYSGADAITAIHEIAHVGYWQMTGQERQVFGSFAIQTLPKFISDVIRSKAPWVGEVDFTRDQLLDLLNTKDENGEPVFGGMLEQIKFLLNYGNLDIRDLNNLPREAREQAQLAIEERFAWEFSAWYAEGYTKGIKPQNIIQRILDRICRTLNLPLSFISKTSERLQSEGYANIKHNGKQIRYNAGNTFENMFIDNRRNIQPSETPLLGQYQGQNNLPSVYKETPRQNFTMEGQPYRTDFTMEQNDASGYTVKDPSQMTNQELLEAARATSNDTPYGVNRQAISEEMTRRGMNVNDRLNEVGQYTGGYNRGEYNGNEVAQPQRGATFEFTDDNAQIFAERIIDENNGDKDKILKMLKEGYSRARNKEEGKFITNVAKRVVATLAARRGETVKMGDTFYTGQKVQEQEQRREPQYANNEKKNVPQETRQIENNRGNNFFNPNPLSLEQGEQQEKSNGQVSSENKENEETRGTITTETKSQNDNRGGIDNGETEESGRGKDLQGTGGEVQGQQTGNGNDTRVVQQREGQIQLETDENNIRLDRRVSRTFNGIFKKLNLSTQLTDWFDVSKGKNQKENFINSIKTAQENNEHGAAVDAPSVDELDGAVIILHKSGKAGFFIKDGDFKGVFKDPNLKVKGISEDMTILARELGAVKGDCYGLPLVRLYARAGFVPVAKLKFNEYYMDKTNPKNKFLLEEQPYVYSLTVDTKDLSQFHKNLKDGVYGQNFSNKVLDTADSVVEIQDYDTAVRLGKDENGEQYIRDLDELSEEETEKLKEELGKYKFWDGKDLWYGGYSELLNYRDNELNKMPDKEKRVRNRSKTAEFKTQDDILKYVKEKTGDNFNEQEAKEGIEDAVTLIDDRDYSGVDEEGNDKKLYQAEKLFAKILDDKPQILVDALIDKIKNARKNVTNSSHDLAFLLEAERKLNKIKTEENKQITLPEETKKKVKQTIDVVYDKVFKPYFYVANRGEGWYLEDALEDTTKEEKQKNKEKQKNENKQKTENKKKNNLTDAEQKEYNELTKKEIKLKQDEFTNEDLVRWSELSDIKDGETLNRNGQIVPAVRYMKQEVKNAKVKEYMGKLYKDNFYNTGRKLGFDTHRITAAYNSWKYIRKYLVPSGEKNGLLYLNPKDEKVLGQNIKDFAKLNHLTNAKLWEMNLKDKNNKMVYGKGMYRSPDGRWMQEFSDDEAKLNINKLTDDMLNSGSLAGLNYKLGDLIKHDELFKRFPELKNLPVHFIDKNMVEDGEIEGVTIDDMKFAMAYDYKDKQMFVDVDEFLGDGNQFFDNIGVWEKLESGEEDQMQEAAEEIREAIEDMLPFFLHETQHAIQHIEGRGQNKDANRVTALVIHSDLKNIYQQIKNTKNSQIISLAQKELKNYESILNFLNKENKTGIEEKLEDILDNYMDNEEFYYSDMNEVEAYDTQHRFKNDETSLPLTMAENNAYQNFEEGKGMLIRAMQGSVNGKNFPLKDQKSLALIEAVYKRDFYYIGQKMRLTKDKIDLAYNKKKELADGKSYFIKLDLSKDENLKNFVNINDSIKATWWVKGLKDSGKNTVFSRGIYVDLYGKWCYTIDHSNATWNRWGFDKIVDVVNGKSVFNPRKKTKLGDILNFPELFEEYPQLKDIPVQVKKSEEGRPRKNADMWFNPRSNSITINPLYFSVKDLDNDEKLRELIHEVQHAIQNIEKEVWGQYGGFDYIRHVFDYNADDIEDKLNKQIKLGNITEKEKNNALKAFKEIINNPNEFNEMYEYVKTSKKKGKWLLTPQTVLSRPKYGLTKNEITTLTKTMFTILNSDQYYEAIELLNSYDNQYTEMMASDINIEDRPKWGVQGYNSKTTPQLLGRKSYLDFKMGKSPAYRWQKGEKLSTQDRVEVSNQILDKAFPNVRFQYAWHSTPHDFDAFTLDHLLEGEGFMAHGWGLYFAKDLPKNYENYFTRFNGEDIKVYANGKDISRTYRLLTHFITNRNITEDEFLNMAKEELNNEIVRLGQLQEPQEVSREIITNIYKYKNKLKEDGYRIITSGDGFYIDAVTGEYFGDEHDLKTAIEESEDMIKELQDAISNVEIDGIKIKKEEKGTGKILHVDIPNDNVLIRKGAKLKNQPKNVQRILYKLLNNIGKMTNFKLGLTEQQFLNVYGNKIIDYDYFAKTMLPTWFDFDTGNKIITQEGQKEVLKDVVLKTGLWNTDRMYQEFASKLLNKYGIKGVSYEGARDGECAVVFDNKAIDIIDKFKREEGKWVSVKPPSQKQELTDTQKQRVERKLNEKKNNTTRYQQGSSQMSDDQIAREHTNVRSVSFTESAQKNATNRKIMKYFDKHNKDFERTVDPNTKKVTYTRRRPEEHHTQNINYNGVNDKVVTKTEKYGKKYKVKEELFNNKEAIKKLASDLGVPEAYQKMMVYALQGQKANVALTEGVEYNGKKTKGLYQIMRNIPEELQTKFLEYAIAFRILDFEKYRPDIVQKMTADEAREIIKEVQNNKQIAPLFEQTRKDFVEYNIAMLHDSLVKNGVISQELFNNMVAKDPNFVPLAKIMDEDVDFGYQSASGARSLIDIKAPIKGIKSSVREIKNPFAEMEKRTYEYYNTGAKNKAALTMINDVVNKIDVLVDGDKIAKGQGILRKVKIQEKDGKIITKPDPKNRIFYVCNNGVHEFYQAADPVVYAVIKNFTEEQAKEMSKVLDKMEKISKGMATVVRESATITYDFGMNNAIRDTMGAFVASEHGFIPIYDTIWGIRQVMKGDNSHYYKEYSGQVGQYAKSTRGELLANNTFKVPARQLYEGYIKEVKKNYAIFTNKKYSATQRAKAFLKMTLGAPFMSLYTNAQNFNELIEQGTRVAEYKNARQGYNGLMDRIEKGGLAWDVDVSKDVVDKAVAAYKALDVTLFFQQHGNLGKSLNKYTPFFNAYLLGLEKTLNSMDLLLTGKDAMNQTNKTLQKEMLFKVVFFSLLGVAVSAAGAGDDDYEEAPDWEKNTFWILPDGVRFGRDEIFGRTIGRIAEEAYTQARHKNFNAKKLGGIAIDAFTPNSLMPTILDIYGGLYMNRDSFTKRDIVPERMKSLPGPKQIDMYTSNIAKDFSSVMYALGINVSAKQVNYLLQKHFTNTFKYAEDAYSLIRGKENGAMARGYDKNDATGELVGFLKDDVPRPLNRITGKFITNRTQYQSVNEFEDEYKELKGKEKAKDLNPLTKEEQAKWKKFDEAEKKMNKIRKKLKEIRENKNLNNHQKQEKADRLFAEQLKIAKKALGKE